MKSDLSKLSLLIIKQLIAQNKDVKFIRCDNAGENKTLQKECIDQGLDITFEYTAPYSPQFNGKVVRAIYNIWNKVRASMIGAGIPRDKNILFWTECASTVVKTNNITVTKSSDKCPAEILHKKLPPYVDTLQSFGNIAIIKENKMIKSKLDNRGIEAMFVGYADDHAKGVYRFLNLKSGKIVMSRNYVWTNKTYGEFRNINGKETQTSYDVEIEINTNPSINNEQPTNNEPIHDPPTPQEDDDIAPQRPAKIPREIRNLDTSYNDASQMYVDEIMDDVSQEFAGFALSGEEVLSYPDEPTSFEEAWYNADPREQEGWRSAIKKEFNDMKKMKVWRRIKKSEVPSERRIIGNKWVFKRKRDGRYRARLCGLGYTQIAGVDFTANHAPVVNDVSFRIMLVLKMIFKWSTSVIDVAVAFLHGDMEELIFMKLPVGMNLVEEVTEEDDDDCVILDKCIYGTVQAARQWSKKFRYKLQKLKFIVSTIDPCIMIRHNKNGIVILCIYVDDVCLMGDDAAIEEAINDIESEFKIRREGPLKDYLGCIIEFSNDEATIHQPHILKKLCTKFGSMTENLKIMKTPSPPGSLLKRPTEDEELINEELQELYRSGVGTLLYLTKQTRPDIANSVREHSKMMDGATKDHLSSLLRLIKYVIQTQDRKLLLKLKRNAKNGNIFSIVGYSDSDYASDKDHRKSVTGMVIYICGIPVAWKSKGQKAVTLSTTEAEYYALSEMCSELIFIKNILEFIGVKIQFPIVAKVDNVGAMFLSNNHAMSQRTKHISIRQHFIRQFVEDGIIKVIFVRSKSNDSDIFTKNLSKDLYEKHRKKIMTGIEAEKYNDVD